MRITVCELIELTVVGDAPKHVKYNGAFYKLTGNADEYEQEFTGNKLLKDMAEDYCLLDILEAEVIEI